MSEDLIRIHIAMALAERIANGNETIYSDEFSDMEKRVINPNTMKRYIPKEPLFTMCGERTGYPVLRFYWIKQPMFTFRAARDWDQVLAACFTDVVLDKWMFLETKSLRSGKQDKQIKTRQVMLIRSSLAPLRLSKLSREYTTADKIQIVNEQIKTFWNVVYGHK